jgi:peptidoglycan-associated lipoprotein
MYRISIAVIALSLGCSKHAAVKTTPPAVTAVPTAKPVPATPPAPASPNVAVSDDLAKACMLKLDNVQSAPKFDFDTFELLPSDRDVLQQVATCVTSGPLKGKKLELTGRADPRGTEEYNLGLGTRRAGAVASYLEKLGVGQTQLAETTRGAIDAAGTDESTWKTDRRVDLRVEN